MKNEWFDKQSYSIDDAAILLGVSRERVRQLMEKGVLTSFKKSNKWWVGKVTLYAEWQRRRG